MSKLDSLVSAFVDEILAAIRSAYVADVLPPGRAAERRAARSKPKPRARAAKPPQPPRLRVRAAEPVLEEITDPEALLRAIAEPADDSAPASETRRVTARPPPPSSPPSPPVARAPDGIARVSAAGVVIRRVKPQR